MELISKKDGAVFFVDILGITALTNGSIELTDEDYSPWLELYNEPYTEQFLAASILIEFRKILIKLNNIFTKVTISQLSDCAFVWSENITDVVLFAANFMTEAIRNGLLCRGGLTYGEIIETNQEHKLGRFIVGKAVSDAAKLERIAKGTRILIDQEFPNKLFDQDKNFSERTIPLFTPFVNPLDYNTYDEFKWYLCPDIDKNVMNLSILRFDDKIKLTKQRLKIANIIRCSPKFRWNSKSKEGLVQVKASISFISDSGILDIKHNFGWSDLVAKRDEKTLVEISNEIDTYLDYRPIIREKEREWAE
ncbi:MAG: hypothetical protein LBC75_11010 [Fibromonadaceae bacterium]|jgi:hypothetical protein|nr:hypothetical protein [Fibromonadaceae bacterium]